jgi:arylsulfatase A-like enzyme
MNIICIMLDSFRQDHLSFYNQGQPVFEGVPACQTPHLDEFARQSVVFDNAYPEALPTIPIRTQFFTGMSTLPFRPWQPLAREDVSVAEILHPEGYTCGLITDTYHFRAPGMNFHRNFKAYRWIRGQEYDAWKSHPPKRDVERYFNEHYDEGWRERTGWFLSNTDDFQGEEDWFAWKVVDEAIAWLRENRGQPPLFAWIDSFDPHEPWDPPARFDTYTDPAYTGKRLIMPMGGPAEKWATPEEIRHIRGLYAGEAAFVDHCLGRLFASLQEQGFYEDSIILVAGDHGHPLADHGKFLKGPDRLYNELLKVPFMIRLPDKGQAGPTGYRRSQALVQFHDVLPTLLELAGLGGNAPAFHGRSFAAAVRGRADDHRPAIITGYHEGLDRCVRDRTWSYIQRPEGEPDELYNLVDDPREARNLIDRYPKEAQRLAGTYGRIYQHRRASHPGVKGVQGRYVFG